jgi:hypothetical protein
MTDSRLTQSRRKSAACLKISSSSRMGDAQIEMNRPRKDGGSENADAGQACCPRATCCSGEEACSSSYSDAKRGASSAQPYRRLSA